MRKGCKAENAGLTGGHVDTAGMDAKNISWAKALDLASLSIESKGMTKRQEVKLLPNISEI